MAGSAVKEDGPTKVPVRIGLIMRAWHVTRTCTIGFWKQGGMIRGDDMPVNIGSPEWSARQAEALASQRRKQSNDLLDVKRR